MEVFFGHLPLLLLKRLHAAAAAAAAHQPISPSHSLIPNQPASQPTASPLRLTHPSHAHHTPPSHSASPSPPSLFQTTTSNRHQTPPPHTYTSLTDPFTPPSRAPSHNILAPPDPYISSHQPRAMASSTTNSDPTNTTTTTTSNPAAADAAPPPTRIRGSVVAHLDTSTPAINASPVEIDGTPTSPDRVVMMRTGSWGNNGKTAAPASSGRRGSGAGPQRTGSSPDYLAREEEVLEEFGLIGGKENRAALLQSRKRDPAVLVDIPQGPSVEDFAAAGLLSPDAEDKKVEPAR